jgi:integrase
MESNGLAKNVRLTAANFATLPCPRGLQQKWYPDQKVPGLALCVLASGARSWYINKKRNGRLTRLVLGDARILSLPVARDRAQKMLGEMSGGVDLAAERRASKIRGITVEQALEGYVSDHVNLKPRTKADYATILKRHACDWLRRPLAEINGQMLLTRHRKIGATNRAGANYLIRIIRALWNWAAVNDPKTFGANPAKAIGAVKAWYKIERKRTRLAPHEIGPWWHAVGALEPESQSFLRTLLLLGLRVGEASKLCGADLNVRGATLAIVDAKAGSRTAYLGKYSLSILEKLKALAGDGPLFPSRDRYQTAMRTRLRNVNAKADVSITFHCLRRSFASTLEAIGAPYIVTKMLLGHALPTGDVSAGYIVPTQDLLRYWQQKAEDYIVARARDRGEVVLPLPAKAKRRKAAAA